MAGQERSKRPNFDFEANRALLRPARPTWLKTDETGCPAASCTVIHDRSVFQVTPWPWAERVIRRLVTIEVWLGRVTLCSYSLRASRVEAPPRISR